MADQESKFRRSITVAEAIISALLFLGLLITTYVNIQVRLNALEIRVSSTEKFEQKYSDDSRMFGNKLDKIQSDISDIKVNLQNKQDRK